jgi:SAM-dependent methyltransferase
VLKSGLNRIFERFARSLGILEVQSRLDHLESQQKEFVISQGNLYQALFEQSENAKTVIPMIQAVDQLNETRSRKLVLDAKLEIELGIADKERSIMLDVNHLTENILVQLRRDMDGIRALVKSVTSISPEVNQSLQQSSVIIDDALYVSLEDRFRGDAQIVMQRQKDYLPYVEPAVSVAHPLLDLGCGRGEWLLLLKDKEIPSWGIDSNDVAIAECESLGLQVVKSDLLTTLHATSSQSIGAVTMFQVLEHLPFDLVVEVLRESLRVLIPGGVFIGEIPNCETLRVGASTFWIDPTHQRPLYPAVLEFIASEVGFRTVEGRYSSPLAPTPSLENLPEQVAIVIRDLHYKVNGPGDFAVIAQA